MTDGYSRDKGGGMYLYSVLNCSIFSSNFYNNKVFFNNSIPNYGKTSNHVLSKGGAIYFEPYDFDISKSP